MQCALRQPRGRTGPPRLEGWRASCQPDYTTHSSSREVSALILGHKPETTQEWRSKATQEWRSKATQEWRSKATQEWRSKATQEWRSKATKWVNFWRRLLTFGSVRGKLRPDSDECVLLGPFWDRTVVDFAKCQPARWCR